MLGIVLTKDRVFHHTIEVPAVHREQFAESRGMDCQTFCGLVFLQPAASEKLTEREALQILAGMVLAAWGE
jgi:hypothetical protein